jgi:hypothetical protein
MMLHRGSTIQKSVPCQPSRRSSHPVRTSICHCSIRSDDVPYRSDSRQSKHHPSARRVSPSGHSTFQQHVRTPLNTRTVSDSFQVPIKEISINRPNDVVSRLDARLLKARIAIQISPLGRLTAVVRTHVHQRRKLPIRLQPSGRLPIMVRTRAHQI